MINLELAADRGICLGRAETIQRLQCEIDVLLVHWEYGEFRSKENRKWLKRILESREYQLQEAWKFDRDRDKHTHWRRFNGLYRKRGKLYAKPYV